MPGLAGKKYIIKARRARPRRTRQGLNPSRTRLRGGERGRGGGPGRFISPRRGAAAPALPSAPTAADPALGATGAPRCRRGARRFPVHGSGCGLGLSSRVSWEGGGRGGGRRSPRGGKRKRRRVRNGGASCTSRSPGPPSSPRRDHKMEDAAGGGRGAGHISPPAAAPRSPGSAGLWGRAAPGRCRARGCGGEKEPLPSRPSQR